MIYVALLRGINVGGNNKVSMAVLKEVMVDAGYKKVKTYINSGNIVFESDNPGQIELADQINHLIEVAFGLNITVVIRSFQQIQELCAQIPAQWINDSIHKTDVMFLYPEFDYPEVVQMVKAIDQIDTLLYLPGALVWHVLKSNYNQSGMNSFIGTKVYKNMTARNSNTVRKILQIMKDINTCN